MFEIMQKKEMESFLENISSFPTSIYTALFLVCIFFWLCTLLGFLDLDVIEFDIDADSGIDADADITNNGGSTLTGILLKFGLVGAPMIITFSLLVMIGWLSSFYIVHFLVPFEAGSVFRYLVGLPIFLITLYFSALVTSMIIKPLKPLFRVPTQSTKKLVLGQTATVRTLRVDNDFGEAMLDDGGAGLIMKVRTRGEDRFKKGDKVVIFEKISDDNIYRVISEEEFNVT